MWETDRAWESNKSSRAKGFKVCSVAPVDESQTLTVLSEDADATSLSSGESTTELIQE